MMLNGYNDIAFRGYAHKNYPVPLTVKEKNAAGIASEEFFDHIGNSLKAAHAFNVSNVSGIIQKIPANTSNMLPPFPVFWIEGVGEPVLDAFSGKTIKDAGIIFGLLVEAFKKKGGGYYFQCCSFIFPTKLGIVVGPQSVVICQSDEQGNVIGTKSHTFSMVGRGFSPVPQSRLELDIATDLTNLVNFLGLINAKNISCPMRSFELNNYNKRKLKATGANDKYHILKIHKPGEKIKTESTGENEGKMPLHVVRGHLRTTNLFGKYPGTYFIPSHMRGNEKNGKVTKDYALV